MLIVGAALTNTGLTMRSHELSENSIGYIGTATLQGTEENSAINSRTSPTSNKVGALAYFFMCPNQGCLNGRFIFNIFLFISLKVLLLEITCFGLRVSLIITVRCGCGDYFQKVEDSISI